MIMIEASKVFLGGTCADSTWREELMPIIQVAYFNPVVENWTPECVAKEEYEKNANCDIHLYVITTPKSIYSIAEVVQSSLTVGKTTILHVIPSGFDEFELKHMTEICNLVKSNGAIVYIDEELSRTARVINFGFKVANFS